MGPHGIACKWETNAHGGALMTLDNSRLGEIGLQVRDEALGAGKLFSD
jgi:hypothetical protein